MLKKFYNSCGLPEIALARHRHTDAGMVENTGNIFRQQIRSQPTLTVTVRTARASVFFREFHFTFAMALDASRHRCHWINLSGWLPVQESNLRRQLQRLSSCH